MEQVRSNAKLNKFCAKYILQRKKFSEWKMLEVMRKGTNLV